MNFLALHPRLRQYVTTPHVDQQRLPLEPYVSPPCGTCIHVVHRTDLIHCPIQFYDIPPAIQGQTSNALQLVRRMISEGTLGTMFHKTWLIECTKKANQRSTSILLILTGGIGSAGGEGFFTFADSLLAESFFEEELCIGFNIEKS